MTDRTLQLDGVGKQYGDVWSLRDVSLSLSADDGVVGILGPNGAGKSTLFQIIATVMKPTEGTITWGGTDIVEQPEALRGSLGYLPQDFGVYQHLTADEFLDYMGALDGLDRKTTDNRIDELLRITDLKDARDRRLETYSGGMLRRIGIARALLSDPDVLVVDEPTVGLDPEKRVTFRNLLTDLARDRLVLFSTHIVPDIEATASSVAVLNNGRLVTKETPSAMLSRVENQCWTVVVPDEDLPSVREGYTVSSTVRQPDGVAVRLVSDDPPSDATKRSPTLEDAYLALLGSDQSGTVDEDAQLTLSGRGQI
jgi:ABC-2 type transport system ATP-binding protein